MKKSLLAVGVLAASAIALTGCSLASPGAPDESAGPSASGCAFDPNADPINIGAVLPVTGVYTILGAPQKEALELEADYLNKNGGILCRPVKVDIKDDASVPPDSAKLYNELAATGTYDVMLTSSMVAATEAAAPGAEKYEIPTLALGPSQALTDGKNKWDFVVPNTSDIFAKATVEYMQAVGKYKKLAIAYIAGDAYGEGGKASTESYAKDAGIDIVSEQGFDRTATDFAGLLKNVKDSGADSLIVWGSGAGPSILTAQFAGLGLGDSVQLFMTGSQASDLYIKSKGAFVPATQGVIIGADLGVPGTELPAGTQIKGLVDDFAARWKTVGDAQYTYPPQFAFEAAAALQIAKAAIEKAGSTDPDAVRDALEQTDIYTYIGAKHYTATDHAGGDVDTVAMVVVKDGDFKATDYALDKFKQLK